MYMVNDGGDRALESIARHYNAHYSYSEGLPPSPGTLPLMQSAEASLTWLERLFQVVDFGGSNGLCA